MVLSSLYLFSFCCSEDTLNYLDCFLQPKCYLNKMKMNLHQGKILFYRPFQVRYSFNHLKSSLRSSSCLHERQVGEICFLFDINNYYFAIILHFEICFNYLKYCWILNHYTMLVDLTNLEDFIMWNPIHFFWYWIVHLFEDLQHLPMRTWMA